MLSPEQNVSIVLGFQKKYPNFLKLFLIGFLISCSPSNDQKETNDFEPRFVVTDSLVIDYLGNLTLLDIKMDQSEYLFHDFQREEFVRVDPEGEILQRKNLKEDSRDSFGASFLSAHYLHIGEIAVFTFEKMYRYDSQLQLLNSLVLPFSCHTNTVGGGHVNLIYKEKLFTNSIAESVIPEEVDNYPYLTVYDLEKEELLARDPVPSQAAMIQNPGIYRETAPFSLLQENHLYLLFPNSPEIYKYSFPELELLETIPLDLDSYVQAPPAPVNGELGSEFFIELASSSFTNLYASNGLLMVSYLGAAPQEEVDALPKNILGSQPFNALVDKYKIPYYQVIKDGKKLWEGNLEIDFKFKQGQIYSKLNLHLPKVDEELDYLTFYFYEIL